MPAIETDTICAIATPVGRSGIGIVRLSGPDVAKACEEILGFLPSPRHAHYCDFLDADQTVIDQGVAIYYQSPDSFTGEDILELQGHGGVYVLNAVLERVLLLDIRLAGPGEFSERAFLNDKIDLLQAEAIADLIDANSKQAVQSAMRTLRGQFSELVHHLVTMLTTIRVSVEAAIDFSDEDIDLMADAKVEESIEETLNQISGVYAQAQQGALLKDGLQVVITGIPNAGKSSLLNALSGIDSAIVTDIPGTTRDLLKEEISIDGMPIHIIDTAGLRTSDNIVEIEGVKRTHGAIETADQILLVFDCTGPEQDVDKVLQPLNLAEKSADSIESILTRCTLIYNKIDLLDNAPSKDTILYKNKELSKIHLSAKQGTGIGMLRDHLKTCAGFRPTEETAFVARERHLAELKKAEKLIKNSLLQLSKGSHLELVAEDLRLAQNHLSTITGEFTSDDLLGEIFSSFCIGK
ncbi:MAG: tRNA uridine-5-carboxymethylaminomethyl(34) synthesis GTPase MnmE [Pseudomonadales bacterium]|nr:tRNA uridine-5-carboxymethylaminomethyl(34) synthesis GTPase MnmE [Pseudomonadales bacterium]